MINVYIDPPSYLYLGNELFKAKPRYDRDNILSFWLYLRDYCLERGLNLNTIDFWKEDKPVPKDIYVSFEHKNWLRKLRWHFLDQRYPTLKLDKFKKKILFQFEPPMVMPEVYLNLDNLVKIYDKIFFACKIDNPKIQYFHYYQTYDRILDRYWRNLERNFLVIINSNKGILNIKKFLTALISTAKTNPFDYKELISERLKAIEFFSKTKEIDLYGLGWDKLPPFPYWILKKTIKKIYKGKADSKYQILSQYNFSICYENSVFPGYISEKIFDCFFAGNIPIYFGAPDIEEYIPKDCFIDMRDFKNYTELRDFLKSLGKAEIENYKEKGRQFLESEKFRPFSKEHFAELFVKSCLN